MKKAITGIVVLIAGLSFAALLAPAAMAETQGTISEITPAQRAVLNQELEAMKAILLQLQSQYTSSGQTATVSQPAEENQGAMLSQNDLEALSKSLISLQTALTGLETQARQNVLSAEQKTALAKGLTGIQNALVALSSQLGAAGPAIASSNQKSAVGRAPVATEEGASKITLNGEASQNSLGGAEETAQVNSALKVRKWSVYGAIALVVILAAIWVYRGREEKTGKKGTKTIQPYVEVDRESA